MQMNLRFYTWYSYSLQDDEVLLLYCRSDVMQQQGHHTTNDVVLEDGETVFQNLVDRHMYLF